MAHQSPMMYMPKKTTDDVDWTAPIRTLIAQSYGEAPDSYSAECAALQRCRQDAVRGAGADMTARDLLYKYFGQLELLELRFAEIRVNFPWHDAFTNKLITQTSIAYEKASILFQIAATHSSIAASQNRSDPEGLKRSFYYFRTCAGMLTYINENFLHAPSTDLSREVVKFLVDVIIAQATEVFFEKCVDEKKGHGLVAKIGAQAAYLYTGLGEQVKEFMGKGIFDRNWVLLIQIKTKYFTSLSQYYRALADDKAGKHGDALVRFILAETLAKEASRLSIAFASGFVPNLSPTLPADAGPSIQERTKAHLATVSERRVEAGRENDLIYNAILPAPEALPAIEKAPVATPVPIQDIYGTPEVQKVIGPDIFIKLIPLSVHESASVYSEEKAKMVRGEVEKAEGAEGEARSVLHGLGVKEGLGRYKAMVEGEVSAEEEIPLEVRRWIEDIALVEERECVTGLMTELDRLKGTVRQELDGASRDLEIESKDCEMMRVKFEHLWTQEPSAGPSKSIRQDLKSHYGALDAASSSDQQVTVLWDSVRSDIGLLLSPGVEEVFRASTGSAPNNLLDLDVGDDVDDANERAKIGQFVEHIEERLSRLSKISHERQEVLRDLKEKIQTDDVSHLLLLNRRNSGVEPSLFAAELEKFSPYQQRLVGMVQHQQAALTELTQLWKGLKDLAGRGPGARKWEEREKRKKVTVKRFSRARDGYMEVRDGLAKGLQFYNELAELSGTLRRTAKSFVASRNTERERLAGQLETHRRLSSAVPPPLAGKPRVPPPPSGLNSSFSSMNLGGNWGPKSPPPAPPSQYSSTPSPQSYSSPPPSQAYSNPSYPPQQQSYGKYKAAPQQTPSYMPPPPSAPSYASSPPPPSPQHQQSYSSAPPRDPYAGLDMFGSSAQKPPPPPPPPPSSQPSYNQQHQPQYSQPQQQQQQYTGGSYSQQQPSYGQQQQPPPQQQQQYGGYSAATPQGGLPPPPAPQAYQYNQQPPPPQNQQQYQGFPPPPPQQGQGQYGRGW